MRAIANSIDAAPKWSACRASWTSACWELALLILGLEWVLWTDSKRVLSQPMRVAGILVLVGITLMLLYRQRPHPGDLGLAPRSWTAGLGRLIAFTIAAMLGCFGVGLYFDSIGSVEHFGRWILRNWYMEGVQQLLLQAIVVPRLGRIMQADDANVSLAAATIFSLLHAPSPLLMGLTFIGAFVWCEWFRNYRNLPALWASHLALAATALYCLNGPLLKYLRVGVAYLFYSRSF